MIYPSRSVCIGTFDFVPVGESSDVASGTETLPTVSPSAPFTGGNLLDAILKHCVEAIRDILDKTLGGDATKFSDLIKAMVARWGELMATQKASQEEGGASSPRFSTPRSTGTRSTISS